MTARIGSLCTGVGGLELAVADVIDAEPAWFAQYEPPGKDGKPAKQHAAAILAHHWPDVPNHGDITTIDYSQVEPVDILLAGWPCQDMSLAGKQAGMMPGTRSGLWTHVARAISELRPSLVFLENVRSLTSARAHSDLEPCPWCLGDGGDQPHLRALGCVLGDLADLGFDAEWTCLRASDVGAPHHRDRAFVLAWPAAADPDVEPRQEWRVPGSRAAESRGPRPDAGRPGGAQDPFVPSVARGAAPSAAGDGRDEGRPEPARILGRPDASLCGSADAADAHGAPGRLDIPRGRPGPVQGPEIAQRAPEQPRRLHRGDRSEVAMAQRERDPAAPDTGRDARPGNDPDGAAPAGSGESPLDWGDYAPAIRRWEHILGRPAPRPTNDRGRLAAPFPEWMMGLPEGHVTAVPGIPHNAQLHAIGNGVVPAQGAAALRILLQGMAS